MFHCIARTTPSLVFVDPERADILQASAAGLKSTVGTKFVIIEDDGKGPWPGISILRSQVQSYHGDTLQVLKDDPQIVPEDNATIIYTSGTSGLPSTFSKLFPVNVDTDRNLSEGVLSSQRAFLSNLLNVRSLTALS